MAFKIGDIVTWDSQSAGSTARKIGNIIEVVPAHRLPATLGKLDKVGRSRDHDSYVVSARVERGTGTFRGAARKYWPRVSNLQIVAPAANAPQRPLLERAAAALDNLSNALCYGTMPDLATAAAVIAEIRSKDSA